MFSKKPEQSSPLPVRKPMANNATFSVLGPDVTITGDIEASADLHVDGTVKGDLSCSSLVQGEGSHIQGNIKAERARLSGKVTGTIAARELVILKSAKIEGDVSYETLTIEQGAAVEGRFAPKGLAGDSRGAPASKAGVAAKDDSNEPKLSLASN